MVAALFEGDLKYGVTVFGKPRSLEAVTVPSEYPLPCDVINCVDVDFIFYPGMELFRVFRVGDDANGVTLFSIQTHAYSFNSSRPKPFIGAGIFARAGVRPEALVQALRDLMHGAQNALVRDGKFIVQGIGTHEKRLLVIPDSVEAVRAPNAAWFPVQPVQTGKHVLIVPTATGVSTPEQFFERVLSFPYAFTSNTFFCQDPRVAKDCRERTSEFDVMSSTAVYERACKNFASIYTKQASLVSELSSKNKELAALHRQHGTPGEVVRNVEMPSDIGHLAQTRQYTQTRPRQYTRQVYEGNPNNMLFVRIALIAILIMFMFGIAFWVYVSFIETAVTSVQ